MIRMRFIVAISLWAWLGSAMAAPLLLFGVPLQDATRATLTPALEKAGLPPIPNGPQQWCDTYRINGQMPQLQGASKFSVKYDRHNRFALAEYKFPSFGDTRQVQDIIAMVTYKYGPPSSIIGEINHGPVVARWKEGGSMEIKVWRGWPITTTYMDLENVAIVKAMRAERLTGMHGSLPARMDTAPINENKEWEPPSPVEQIAQANNQTVPTLLVWGVIAFFLVPAVGMVIFGHFLARVTRIPRFNVAARVFFARLAQFFRRPGWFLKGRQGR